MIDFEGRLFAAIESVWLDHASCLMTRRYQGDSPHVLGIAFTTLDNAFRKLTRYFDGELNDGNGRGIVTVPLIILNL